MPRPGGVIAGLQPLQLLGALASGLLLVLIFPSADLGRLAWVALVPLLVGIWSATPGAAFRVGFIAGVVAYGGIMSWIRVFGGPAWILLSLGMAAFLGGFAALASALAHHYSRSPGAAWLWAAPVTWIAVEVVRSMGPLGFPWALLGLTQHRNPEILTLASWVGAWGIGGLIVLVNAGIAAVLRDRRLWRPAGIALVAAVAVTGASNRMPPAAPASARVVAAVQPNLPPQARGDPATSAAIIEGLLRQTQEARSAGAEIIVYPETAIPLDVSAVAGTRLAIARAAGGAAVVAGAFLPGPQNGAIVIGPDGETLGRYAKQKLVPFGEVGLRPGADIMPVRTPAGALGLAICYESSFSDLGRRLAGEGADLLAVLTNDGWFGPSAGPPQHAAHAVLRAAETGRSLVRAANTGTSMLIRPDGVVVAAQPLGTAGVIAAALPAGGPLTPYVRWGWLIAPLAVLGVLVAAAPIVLAAAQRQPGAAARLVVAVVVPGLIVAADRIVRDDPGGLGWPAAAGLLIVSGVVGRGVLYAPGGVLRSAVVSLAVTGALVLAMQAAYATYGFDLPVGPAGGSWVPWLLVNVLRGTAVEAWLRGAVYGRAVPFGGWPLAVLLPTVLGVAMHAGMPQEIVFWHLFTGVAFGAVRWWTGDAIGLGPARGLGDAVVASLVSLR